LHHPVIERQRAASGVAGGVGGEQVEFQHGVGMEVVEIVGGACFRRLALLFNLLYIFGM
jgi:hypothetical protein